MVSVWLVGNFLPYAEYLLRKAEIYASVLIKSTIKQQLFNDSSNVMNLVRVIIASLNKKYLTEIADVMNDRRNQII